MRFTKVPIWLEISGDGLRPLASASRHFSDLCRKPKVIAVLPFQNAGTDEAIDFLQLALPDEIANTLSYVIAFDPSICHNRQVQRAELGHAASRSGDGVTSIVTGH
jgi:TolB-like protein